MRSVIKWAARLLIVLVVFVAALFTLPRESIQRIHQNPNLSDPAAFLAAREGVFDDITPGTEARILWAGEEGARSDWVVLYLHGFSATSEEIRPVPDELATALNANLVFARLRGHGRTGAALGEARAGQWVDDTAFFLDVARAVGERVLIVGTSTGGTLAAYAMTEPEMAEDVAAIAFLSPNFALANPAGRLLELPLARLWVPWIAGATRTFEPANDAHAAFWTIEYPTVATVSLGTLMRETRARDVSEVSVPAIFIFSDEDSVVSASAIREFAANWGGPTQLAPQTLPAEGADPYNHVIAGEILSSAMTEPVVETLTQWALSLP